MRPDWKSAPDWAMWVAMDPCNTWFWYENRPTFSRYGYGWEMNGGRVELAESHDDPRQTLEERPQ